MQVRDIRVRGRRVRFRVAGHGSPVVLVHGLAGSWRWWAPCMPALAERHTVHAVDLPGSGDLREHRFDLADAPAFLEACLDAAGLESAALVGHSMGGVICARLAARAPGRVTRLVLVAPAVDLRPSIAAWALPLSRAAFEMSPHLASLLVADALRTGPVGLARAALDLLADTSAGDGIAAVRAPTLVVWGERDPLVPARGAAALGDRIPGARVHLMPRTGHVPMVEAPGEFARVVGEHLAGGGGGAPVPEPPPGPDH